MKRILLGRTQASRRRLHKEGDGAAGGISVVAAAAASSVEPDANEDEPSLVRTTVKVGTRGGGLPTSASTKAVPVSAWRKVSLSDEASGAPLSIFAHYGKEEPDRFEFQLVGSGADGWTLLAQRVDEPHGWKQKLEVELVAVPLADDAALEAEAAAGGEEVMLIMAATRRQAVQVGSPTGEMYLDAMNDRKKPQALALPLLPDPGPDAGPEAADAADAEEAPREFDVYVRPMNAIRQQAFEFYVQPKSEADVARANDEADGADAQRGGFFGAGFGRQRDPAQAAAARDPSKKWIMTAFRVDEPTPWTHNLVVEVVVAPVGLGVGLEGHAAAGWKKARFEAAPHGTEVVLTGEHAVLRARLDMQAGGHCRRPDAAHRAGNDTVETGVLALWSDEARPLPEVSVALLADQISFRRELLAHNPLKALIEQVLALAPEESKGIARDSVIKNAKARMQGGLDWRYPAFQAALRLIGERADETLQKALETHISDGSQACLARKLEVFQDVLTAGLNLGDDAAQAGREESPKEELRRLLLNKMSQMKGRAFRHVFLIPAEKFFEYHNDPGNQHAVHIHGSNVYRAVLLAMTGVVADREPILTEWACAAVDFLSARCMHHPVEAFWRLGGDFRWPPYLLLCENSRQDSTANGSVYYRNWRWHGCGDNRAFSGETPFNVGNQALDPANAEVRERLKPYLEAFASYLSWDVTTTVLLNTILQDDHVTQLAKDTLGVANLSSHFYTLDDDDPTIVLLDEERLLHLFGETLDLLKMPDGVATTNSRRLDP